MNEEIITEENIHVCLVKQFRNETIADEARPYSKQASSFVIFPPSNLLFVHKLMCILNFYISLCKINTIFTKLISQEDAIYLFIHILIVYLKFSRQKILEQVFLTLFLSESLKNQSKSLFLRARTPQATQKTIMSHYRGFDR